MFKRGGVLIIQQAISSIPLSSSVLLMGNNSISGTYVNEPPPPQNPLFCLTAASSLHS